MKEGMRAMGSIGVFSCSRYALVAAVAFLSLEGCRHAECTREMETAVAEDKPAEVVFPPREWVPLFDGKTLDRWRVVDQFDFSSHGKVSVQEGSIVLEAGSPQTGISWTGALPREEYEVTLEAMRVEGSDFFCGMTFPVGDSPCTFIIGGWGGSVVGLSNVDHQAASENVTSTGMSFENGRWYRVRLRVTKEKIEGWIDTERVFDLDRAGRIFTIWWQQEPVKPFGIATYYTKAALRDIKLRRL